MLTRTVLKVGPAEARLARADWRWMALVVLAGGAAGPVMLMLGLVSTPTSSATLLLNLEGLATMAIAWIVYKENVDRRLILGALAILAGALLVSWQGSGFTFGIGAFVIAGACLARGVDNNLTRKVSGSDPVQIAIIKGLAAGLVNLALAFLMGASLPSSGLSMVAGVVGFFGYGVSLVFFVLALRFLGTARTGAYYSAAPFVGALLALLMFDEAVTWQLGAAGALMAIGLWLHLVVRHGHEHIHDAIDHVHAHAHDGHHQHRHVADDPLWRAPRPRASPCAPTARPSSLPRLTPSPRPLILACGQHQHRQGNILEIRRAL
jgi:drug/metabolite transporter (DMT)-like permease